MKTLLKYFLINLIFCISFISFMSGCVFLDEVETPIFSLYSGSYDEQQIVTITCDTAEATIYYTRDGSDPATSSTVYLYTGPIIISTSTTLKAYAVKNGMVDSIGVTANYTINRVLTEDSWMSGNLEAYSEEDWFYFDAVAGESYYIWWDDSVNGSGTYTCNVKVSAYCANKTTAYFTNVDSGYTTSQIITASATERVYIKVIGYNSTNKGTYAVKYAQTSRVSTPTFSINSGTYDGQQSVTISCATDGATIYYTTDGTNPTTSSNIYSGPIAIPTSTTLKAFAVKSGMADSIVATASYIINRPLTNDIWLSGNLEANSEVDWFYFDAVAGKTYNIWWDDSIQGSNKYTCDIKVSAYRADKTISYFIDVDSGCTTPKIITASATERVYIKVKGNSSFNKGTYSVKYSQNNTTDLILAFSKPSGEYDGQQSVTISCATSGATIYYTRDGLTPTKYSTVYREPITIKTSTTLKAFAVKSGMTDSIVVTANYTINGSLTEGSWMVGCLEASNEEDWFYFNAVAGKTYNIWWDDDIQGSNKYTCDIKVSAYHSDKMTSYFTDVDSGYTTPKIITASATEIVYIKVKGIYSYSKGTYAVKYAPCVETPIFSLTSGEYDRQQSVTISCATDGATIYYTTDGTMGTLFTTVYRYTGPITISTSTTLKAYAVKTGMGNSLIATANYTINSNLTEDSWIPGNLEAYDEEDWFYFDAVAGKTYKIWWDDSWSGSGKYNCDVKISAYRADKTASYFIDVDSGYYIPKIITASVTERVYIKVKGQSGVSKGTYAIKYEKVLNIVSNPYDNIQTGIKESFAPGESWTFMIYMDADNNLESAALLDFREIVSGLNGLGNSNVKVVVLMDRISGYSSNPYPESNYDWTGARIYQVNQNNTCTKKTDGWFTDGAEINMGDPDTLKSFINYCKTNYTSVHYALILWNHGGGTRSKSEESKDINKDTNFVKAVCWDETSSNDCLYLDEIQQSISQYFNSSNKLDFLGFDACLMGMVEVAYEFRDLVMVMAGSMALEWGYGWDLNIIFKNMGSGSNDDPKELGKLVVKAYHDSTLARTDQSQVAVDLTQISSLKTAIDSFAVAIYNENKKSIIETLRDSSYHFYSTDYESGSWPFFDLNDFAYKIISNSSEFSSNLVNSAQAVIDSLSDVVIAAYAGSDYGNYYGLGTDVKRGLSIFFSRGNITYNGYSHYAYQWWYYHLDTGHARGYYYGYIDFAYSDSDGVVETWRELMEAWYDPNNSYTYGSY